MSEIPVLQGLSYIPPQLKLIELNQHQPAIVGINDGISGSIKFVPTDRDKKHGSKYWRLQYRFAGKQKMLALGVYPDVSLSDARQKRDEANSLI